MNWKLGQKSIFNQIMPLKIEWAEYTRTFNRLCIFRPFNFQLRFLIENWFLHQFSIGFKSYSLIRFWILKHKSIMEISFLKWKFKIQFSIFNFWKQKYFSLNPVFNKKFEIEITLNLKIKFPSENTSIYKLRYI